MPLIFFNGLLCYTHLRCLLIVQRLRPRGPIPPHPPEVSNQLVILGGSPEPVVPVPSVLVPLRRLRPGLLANRVDQHLCAVPVPPPDQRPQQGLQQREGGPDAPVVQVVHDLQRAVQVAGAVVVLDDALPEDAVRQGAGAGPAVGDEGAEGVEVRPLAAGVELDQDRADLGRRLHAGAAQLGENGGHRVLRDVAGLDEDVQHLGERLLVGLDAAGGHLRKDLVDGLPLLRGRLVGQILEGRLEDDCKGGGVGRQVRAPHAGEDPVRLVRGALLEHPRQEHVVREDVGLDAPLNRPRQHRADHLHAVLLEQPGDCRVHTRDPGFHRRALGALLHGRVPHRLHLLQRRQARPFVAQMAKRRYPGCPDVLVQPHPRRRDGGPQLLDRVQPPGLLPALHHRRVGPDGRRGLDLSHVRQDVGSHLGEALGVHGPFAAGEEQDVVEQLGGVAQSLGAVDVVRRIDEVPPGLLRRRVVVRTEGHVEPLVPLSVRKEPRRPRTSRAAALDGRRARLFPGLGCHSRHPPVCPGLDMAPQFGVALKHLTQHLLVESLHDGVQCLQQRLRLLLGPGQRVPGLGEQDERGHESGAAALQLVDCKQGEQGAEELDGLLDPSHVGPGGKPELCLRGQAAVGAPHARKVLPAFHEIVQQPFLDAPGPRLGRGRHYCPQEAVDELQSLHHSQIAKVGVDLAEVGSAGQVRIVDVCKLEIRDLVHGQGCFRLDNLWQRGTRGS
ncbi:hypothetical protein CTA1_8927 [Colletotrichum tanaceti]|uniref:Uncharacterized protein n=1 Tax=Colletotrichum tanaceti TaxID=1306861 RepID=A0A4U6X9U0_9PEZI|nr:hypothetical protein CTA1_8927 [Colletotrichum tanaceti]